MPELKKPDDFIIEDPATRELMTTLLGKWSNEQTTQLIKLLSGFLDTVIDTGDAQLRYKYNTPREGYITDLIVARRRRQVEAFAIFQSILGDTIKMHILAALSEAAIRAGKTLTQRIDESFKKENEKRARELANLFPSGHRPEKYTKDSVRRRSVAIMRCLGHGNVTKGRVAMAFYCAIDRFKKGDRGKLLEMYAAMGAEDHRKLIWRFNQLLKDKELDFENLKAEAGGDKSPM